MEYAGGFGLYLAEYHAVVIVDCGFTRETSGTIEYFSDAGHAFYVGICAIYHDPCRWPACLWHALSA